MKNPLSNSGLSLIGSIRLLLIAIPAVSIVAVALVSQVLASRSMVQDLVARSIITADEITNLLEEPLYILDDTQAARIGRALLSSGRISGIVIRSEATGLLLEEGSFASTVELPPQHRSIRRGKILLGTVDLYFSDEAVRESSRSLNLAATLSIVVLIVTSIITSGLLFKNRIQKPATLIFEGIQAIADGDYKTTIPTSKYSDLNELVLIINGMADSIRQKSGQLTEANELLEQRVADRTAELKHSLERLEEVQEMLVESEKLSALGHLSAGMAHEMNTPLGAIISSNTSLSWFLGTQLPAIMEHVMGWPDARQTLLLALIRTAPCSIINSGQINSVRDRQKAVADFLKTNGIAGSGKAAGQVADRAADYIVELGAEERAADLLECLREPDGLELLEAAVQLVSARRMVEVIALASRKAADVVKALRSYIEFDASSDALPVDVAHDIDVILALMGDQTSRGVSIIREYSPAIARGSSDRLSQVWMNLARNAVQAMDYKGELTIHVEARDGKVLVSFADSGQGIPDEVRSRIFDPFFTTKKRGEGMGLGLELSKRIVDAHCGSISLETRPGRTVFTVELPEYPC